MHRKVFLIWKADTSKGEYIPIGSLERKNSVYLFQYLIGIQRAQDLGYTLLPEFPLIGEVYESETLFPLFANRLMSRSRKYIKDYINSIGLESDTELLSELGRTGGQRATDRYRIISMPTQQRGRMTLVFFAVGLTRPPVTDNLEAILEYVKERDRLLMTPQVQNPYDPHAIMLHTVENQLIGWVPGYYAFELSPLLKDNPENFRCEVVRINYPLETWMPDALLVNVTCAWSSDRKPFQSGEFIAAPKQKKRAQKKRVLVPV